MYVYLHPCPWVNFGSTCIYLCSKTQLGCHFPSIYHQIYAYKYPSCNFPPFHCFAFELPCQWSVLTYQLTIINHFYVKVRKLRVIDMGWRKAPEMRWWSTYFLYNNDGNMINVEGQVEVDVSRRMVSRMEAWGGAKWLKYGGLLLQPSV